MANLVTPMPMIRARFFDDNARPLSGGKIYTYEPNTTTPKTTYKDLAATTPNTNPILLDVAGEADIYFDGQYRVIVESWRGERLYDVDNIGALAQIKANFVVDASGQTQQQINDYRKSKFIYPEDFGAVGDGVYNDAVAMQNALNVAATNKRVLSFTHGKTYNCTGVTLDASCHIYGNGATLKGYLRVTGDDLVIRDFNLISTNAVIGLYLFGSTTVPTRYYRQKIHNVKITFDTGVATGDSFGLYASNIDNLEVTSCNIQYAIQLIGCTDYLIDGNIIDGNNYSNNNELIHASRLSYGQILNNTFKNSLDNFIDLYSSGARTIVANNRFLSCKTRLGTAIEIKVTMSDDPANSSSDALGWAEQVIISNNYFYDIKAYGVQTTSFINIYYIDSRAAPSFSWANTPRNFIIDGNIFDGFDATLHGTTYFSAIKLESINAALISNNVFRNLALGTSNDISSCVWIENCQDIIVNSNRMSIKDGTGISLHGDCKNITISNNHILQDLNKSQIPKYGIRITKEGARPDPTITFSKFVGNTVFCSLSAFRQLFYANGYMNDCIISDNVFQEQTDFGKINRCIISDNKFFVGSTRFQALGVGDLGGICAHNTITNNQVESNTTTQKPCISITRLRGSNISGNTARNATHGMIILGTNVAGELDYLNIKDNFSINQTQANFPTLSNINATDSATHQSANNQKIT